MHRSRPHTILTVRDFYSVLARDEETGETHRIAIHELASTRDTTAEDAQDAVDLVGISDADSKEADPSEPLDRALCS